ncbi:MAG: tetratricopeptide repeat protein [Proteobacteria bacterium]|nr:tetratricopeptide repeat protein [Pseudomonadota bacterium]MDA1323719.1 tetratricopeptide repeat protein [Pseudomonadota bacterium]
MRKLYFLVITALFIAPAAVADTAAGIEAFKTKQFATAIKELTPAAEAGDTDALYHLAQMYSGGFGVRKNLTKALELYGKAANKGHVPSQKEYGTALAIGDGAEQDVSEGLKWLLIAARTGDHDAGVYALRFSQLMNRTVVLTARRNAHEWATAFKKTQEAAQD